MEQDRAPPVQLRHDQLARQAAVLAGAIVNLIAATTTRSGLKVYARFDTSSYADKIKVPGAEIAAVNPRGHNFHPDWNYAIAPRAP